MPRKMLPALPETGESPQDRFKRFARAILAVPKPEVPTAEDAIAGLKEQKRKVDRQLAAVQREMARRKKKQLS